MTRPPIQLVEYAHSAPVRLSVAERDALRTAVSGLTIEPDVGSVDLYRLTAGSSVGVVRVGDLTLELRPKVGPAPVLFMLSYVIDPKAWRAPGTDLAEDTDLVEAIVPLFAEVTQAALRPGLLRGYRRQEDTITTVRGRVRMTDQMRTRTGLPFPIEVAYDEFTPDILENQILRSAVDVLGRLRLRHPNSHRSLARLHHQFNGISGLKVDGRSVPEPTWTRLNRHYRPVVSLARLILNSAGLEVLAGQSEARAIVIDMNKVFEDFIRVALREYLGLDANSFPVACGSHRVYLDRDRTVPLEPDLTWWIRNQCVFVGDCKYKRSIGSIPNADVYQMFAYLTALDLNEGMLIYTSGESQPRDIVISSAGQRVRVVTIDLAQKPSDLLSAVAEIASVIDQSVSSGLL